jgi:hypothetical protein
VLLKNDGEYKGFELVFLKNIKISLKKIPLGLKKIPLAPFKKGD